MKDVEDLLTTIIGDVGPTQFEAAVHEIERKNRLRKRLQREEAKHARELIARQGRADARALYVRWKSIPELGRAIGLRGGFSDLYAFVYGGSSGGRSYPPRLRELAIREGITDEERRWATNWFEKILRDDEHAEAVAAHRLEARYRLDDEITYLKELLRLGTTIEQELVRVRALRAALIETETSGRGHGSRSELLAQRKGELP